MFFQSCLLDFSSSACRPAFPPSLFNLFFCCPKLILSASSPFSNLDEHCPAFLFFPLQFSLSLGLCFLSLSVLTWPSFCYDYLLLCTCVCGVRSVSQALILNRLSLACCDFDYGIWFALLFCLLWVRFAVFCLLLFSTFCSHWTMTYVALNSYFSATTSLHHL